jgi:peptidoglycan/xylan/chitin deacetylase (PgdA/CDA1 family)
MDKRKGVFTSGPGALQETLGGSMAVMLLSVDVEGDVPPYGNTYHGVEEGLSFILESLCRHDAEATFFFTYDVAHLYPEAVEDVVAQGFEVGCHGYNHENFRKVKNKEELLRKVTSYLRGYDNVVGFRAPYLKIKGDIYPILSDLGYLYSSSIRGKGIQRHHNVLEIPVSRRRSFSMGMSRMRLLGRRLIPEPNGEVVSLYMHPWEFTRVRLPLPAKILTFRCGGYAKRLLEAVLSLGYEFMTYRKFAQELL